ncbi:MAG: MerR family transcriptional regulator [Lachnospiraceae bacterium]|nr:MerR family transcriptional regulator [Lachnospiraceae bacterium]
MSETRYMISDAARQVGVEAHVLRSWEEELDIKIGRTELGHRYYTDKTIFVMKKVRELREKGFQLKAIKVLIPEIQRKAEDTKEEKDSEKKDEKTPVNTETEKSAEEPQVVNQHTLISVSDNLDNLEKFEDIVGNIVKRALQENNVELENRIADTVLKEMDVLMRIQEKKEEERYRNLDETIRAFQQNRQMVAATKEKTLHRKWFQIFR